MCPSAAIFSLSVTSNPALFPSLFSQLLANNHCVVKRFQESFLTLKTERILLPPLMKMLPSLIRIGAGLKEYCPNTSCTKVLCNLEEAIASSAVLTKSRQLLSNKRFLEKIKQYLKIFLIYYKFKYLH